jgi:hypothetical protein
MTVDFWATIQYLTTLGIGSVVTIFATAHLAMRRDAADRTFAMRKEIYADFLNAYHVDPDTYDYSDNRRFQLLHMTCEIIGSDKTRKAIKKLIETNKNQDGDDRKKAEELLVEAMREDLGFKSKPIH